mmetsp:Transcript_17784/g.50057  ORF Transcript_17784/g.50057 Transcript_17784/m.50057 type:complete len:409 (+) Transcript_17784:147-1373(+)|eukprot:CAMPEP_0119148658 /NCGR_PEP_ID=MMETSP1310-20130426/42172_1 /TAXON_ID=464262 /ORGANISM="Genus nov. species nov., Strain RCC2339" /LENGTH=408 /DNA_ID=CAMNT_0007140707 /DNA_START=69 /DNA_END=1295 /DNA_ORIENTATION=+
MALLEGLLVRPQLLIVRGDKETNAEQKWGEDVRSVAEGLGFVVEQVTGNRGGVERLRERGGVERGKGATAIYDVIVHVGDGPMDDDPDSKGVPGGAVLEEVRRLELGGEVPTPLDQLTSRRMHRELPMQCFVVHMGEMADRMPRTRWELFQRHANMVTRDAASLERALSIVHRHTVQRRTSKPTSDITLFACPWCLLDHLTEDHLCEHMFLYHANHLTPIKARCPVCNMKRIPLAPHIRNKHGRIGRHPELQEHRRRCPTFAFSLVVVVHPKLANTFLVVQEFSALGYWLPGGAVDPGEHLQEAAVRECQEEVGVEVRLTGVLQLAYRGHKTTSSQDACAVLRAVFLATTVDPDGATPKSIPDFESVGACWLHLDDLKRVRWRSDEPLRWFPHVANGGEVFPLSVLGI